MKMNRTTVLAALIGGGILLYPWGKKKAKTAKEVLSEGKPESFFAFVNDPNGEPIYENRGADQIMRLPDKTYVGAVNGKPEDGFVPILIEIDQVQYHVWARAEKLTIIETRQRAHQFRVQQGKDKTAGMLKTLQRYFA